ncbi:Poly [ADP-ribose] polymerase 11 [Acipenser ruthenus]|uniref:Poly [ADP-ribose] polymerase 11 n=1 Tax=Acipenser ruthenus TaxID=7906 RepID=A0A444UNG3_ACIRT|nr:Poly [ADP-ribose] polymerase 11 [Acipenser ruthenus]
MRISKKKIRVQRKSFDDCGQETEWLWYYHGNNGWIEYGQKDSKGSATSLKSSDIEKEYQKKPKNCPKFTAGQTQYEINFKEMRQINLASGHKRRVVRRPKITALQVKTGKTSFTSSSQQQQHVSPRGTKPVWQFEGDSGKWYEFKYRRAPQSATDTESSVSSKEIEAKYQANPAGSMTLKAGRYQYTLNFSDYYEEDSEDEVSSDSSSEPEIQPDSPRDVHNTDPQDSSLSFTNADIEREYQRNKHGLFQFSSCSVQSKDIEDEYQRNPNGKMKFTIGSTLLELDFSGCFFCYQPDDNGTAEFHRRIFLDFDKMEIQGGQMTPYRQISLSQDETEEYLWYFFENRHWHEYGSQGSSKTKASVTSHDIEQQYQINPQGSCTFTVGNMAYSLNFSEMTQSNPRTGMQRRVRRRPKYNSVIQKTNSLASFIQDLSLSSTMPPAGGFTWQFRGDEGVWREYKAVNDNGVACSVSSDDIEQSYQQNPQGQLQFTAGRFSYTLDFSGMSQFNSTSRTKRDVRRIPSENQQKSSEDIEMNYQQNPLGTMNFTAGKFSYILDFSAMTQKNLRTTKTRQVRRLQQ